ncbi:MAG: UGSC family (seleno)protein, partial [Rickettsiales bacterium]
MSQGLKAGPASRIDFANDYVAVNDYFHEQGWSDGLPIIPPTEEAVAEMIAGASLPGDHVLGIMPPVDGTVTIEKVAANAVMAGCKPAYFPVVIAGVKAMLQPKYNVGSVSTTTGGAAPCFMVSGAVAEELGINSGTACMGAGFRANASIGRALCLIIRNIAGAVPGEMDKGTLAFPGRYSLLFAENEARNPWEPLRVAMGYKESESTISVIGIRGVHYINEGAQETG